MDQIRFGIASDRFMNGIVHGVNPGEVKCQKNASINMLDARIEKKAGELIFKPTASAVETFVKKKVTFELATLNFQPAVHVHLENLNVKNVQSDESKSVNILPKSDSGSHDILNGNDSHDEQGNTNISSDNDISQQENATSAQQNTVAPDATLVDNATNSADDANQDLPASAPSAFTPNPEVPAQIKTENGYEDSFADCAGSVGITLFGETVFLPFFLKDGEFYPFDRIVYKKEEVAFSRENLAKILTAVYKAKGDPTKQDNITPWAGLADADNNTRNDNGFLDDLLKIRDTMAFIGANPNNRDNGTITVAAVMDDLLEKTAQIKIVSDEDIANLSVLISEKIADANNSHLEKLAAEDFSDADAFAKNVFNTLEDLCFVPVQQIEDGGSAVLFENANNTFKETNAKVFRKICSLSKEPTKVGSDLILMTSDGRYKRLALTAKAMVSPSSDTCNLAQTTIETAISGETQDKTFLIQTKDSVSLPVTITFKSETENYVPANISALYDQKTDKDMSANLSGSVFAAKVIICKECEAGSDASFARNFEIRHQTGVIMQMTAPGVYATDFARTVLYPVSGGIDKILNNQKEVTFTDTDALSKKASATNQITLTSLDKDRKTFSLVIDGVESTGPVPKVIHLSYPGIDEFKVKNLLRQAMIDFNMISVLIEKSRRNGIAIMEVPQNADLLALVGDKKSSNMLSKTVENIKSSLTSRQTAEIGAKEFLGHQLADVGMQIAPDLALKAATLSPGTIMNAIRHIASDASDLAMRFEKLAAQHESAPLLDTAKAMVIAGRVCGGCLAALDGGHVSGYKQACAQVHEAKEVFEKIAFDMLEFKDMQRMHRNEVVSPSAIYGAVDVMDKMIQLSGKRW